MSGPSWSCCCRAILFSAPRMTILSVSSGNGRFSASASSHEAHYAVKPVDLLCRETGHKVYDPVITFPPSATIG